jgi:NhaP-type Na+/H+ or K+/H+ antiporter
MLALSGAVIVLTSLMSGLVERANLPQVAVFLLLGLGIGPSGLGLMDIGLDSPVLRVVATLGLALVLFTDAVTLNLTETRKHLRLASLILGPGTLLAAFGTALLAHYLLNIDWASSFVIAAALASTDPVMLRGLLRRRDLPRNARLSLRLESGLNDVVLLPMLLIAMAFVPGMREEGSMGGLMVSLFILGPLAGIGVGICSILLLRFARERIGVRRDYESIYSLGVCFAAYAAAEAMHGSGFLAVFAAGIMISALDDDLCDCFVEYGETTAEMLLMFTFVLLGGSLIWSGLSLITLGVGLFVVLALLVRPVALLLSLAREKMDARSRGIITWFGPRGLSTLLLALIPAFDGVPGAPTLFSISALVVLLSVVVHGGSIMFFGKRHPAHRSYRSDAPPEKPKAAVPSAREDARPPRAHLQTLRVTPRVSVDDIDLLIRVEDLTPQMKLADVRSVRSFQDSDEEIAGAVRLDPENTVRDAQAYGFKPDDWIALFCT